MINKLEPLEYLKLNAKLQAKKSIVRKSLASSGVLPREGFNKFDNYKYFSEAQYKELFTKLFTEAGLELTTDELEYNSFEGTEKMPCGRHVRLKFFLTDTETGFWEESCTSGEGLDKGDKAGYKAYTGALKYYLANTFMVATGDDAEADSPTGKATKATYPAYKREREPLPVDDEISMEYAKNKKTTKGTRYEDLPDSQLEWIISSDKAAEISKRCAKMVLDARSAGDEPLPWGDEA